MGSDYRPRAFPDSRASSIASRRGTATPDLSSSTAQFNTNIFPYIHAPRKVQRSRSDVEVRSPGGVPPTTLPALPSPSIDRAATAATIRWAGSGVNVAPYSLPSPEAAELLDPMRKAMPLLTHSISHPKSRLSSFWEESPQDHAPPPVIIPQPPSPEAVTLREKQPTNPQPPKKGYASTSAPRPANSQGDYFSRPHSQTHSRSRSPAVSDELRGASFQSSASRAQPSNPSAHLTATTWSSSNTHTSQMNLMNACALDPISGPILTMASSGSGSKVDTDFASPLGNGQPYIPEQLLTSLSSSVDGGEFFTPSETLIRSDDDADKQAYLVAPTPPDELERRKALYR